jgi:hypothetical protein
VVREWMEGFWRVLGRRGDDVCGVDAVRKGTWRNVEDGATADIGSDLVELVLAANVCLLDDGADVEAEAEDEASETAWPFVRF